ncbi:MAG: RHS repeat-associated core domain-containing protein, partial [Firmicutes bacterium]|nr:RHS repeat-associated core domain-containing protein [Bacillota bacterium]
DVIRMVDVYGNTAAYYEYDPYGNAIQASGSHATINPLRYRGYYYDHETGLYYLKSRYYDPEIGRFINADDVDLLGANGDFTSLNLFAYCGNNPVIRSDESGGAWSLAMAGGGSIGLSLGLTLGALVKTVAAAASVITPAAVVVVGAVAAAGVIYAAVEYAKSKDDSDTDGRITSPIGRRNTYNTRKRAYEAAKRAGGGKEPRHDPNGHDDDNRPHFHPNVSNKYRTTPKGVSSHDHFFIRGKYMINPVEEEIVRGYVKDNKQERLLWELNSPKKRKTVIWKFADSEVFKSNCLNPVKYMSAKQIEKHFSPILTASNVYFIGEDYIGQLTLQQAAQRAQEGEICIIYFGNGIGYYQGEQCTGKPPRFLLSKG